MSEITDSFKINFQKKTENLNDYSLGDDMTFIFHKRCQNSQSWSQKLNSFLRSDDSWIPSSFIIMKLREISLEKKWIEKFRWLFGKWFEISLYIDNYADVKCNFFYDRFCETAWKNQWKLKADSWILTFSFSIPRINLFWIFIFIFDVVELLWF